MTTTSTKDNVVELSRQRQIRWRDDLALATRCVAGEPAAQKEVFRREKPRVKATLYRMLGSSSPIEDLVQDSFLEVFRSLGSFHGEAQLSTWITRITVRVAYAHLGGKESNIVRLESVPDIESHDASAEERVLAREAARLLCDALDGLEPTQRRAFVLHVVEGRPLKEVARLMKVSLVATKTRVWRARRELERRAVLIPVLADFVREAA